MMKLVLSILGCLLIADQINAACPDTTYVKNWTPDIYIGRWFEFARFQEVPPAEFNCMYSDVKKTDNSSVFSLTQTFVVTATKTRYTVEATATRKDPKAALFEVVRTDGTNRSEYRTIITDYKNFTIVRFCTSTGWTMAIRTRVRNPPQAVIKKIQNALVQTRMNTYPLTYISQNNCNDGA